jgi:hypothetical protein
MIIGFCVNNSTESTKRGVCIRRFGFNHDLHIRKRHPIWINYPHLEA